MAEFINPLIPNLGITEQAIAGNAGIILTAADREIIKKRGGDVDTKRNFTDLVKDMLNKSQAIDKVETGDKQNLGYDDLENRIKVEKRLIKHAPAPTPRERVVLSNLAEELKNRDRVESDIKDPYLEYSVYYGQALLMLPVPKERFEHLEKTLSKIILDQIKPQVEISAIELLRAIIKDRFINSLHTPRLATNLVLKTRNANYLFGYYSGKSSLDLPALLELARAFGLTPEELKELYNFDTVTFVSEKLKVELLEARERDEICKLEELLKERFVQMLLSNSAVKRQKILSGLSSIRSKLESFKVPRKRIEDLVHEAKKIAWLKAVIILKELHLKRVFSTSRKEFEDTSRQIKGYTLHARELGLRISREGVKFVEARLENIALETANYKLQLLRSMQALTHDRDREKDILWLSTIIDHLKKTAA